MRHASILWDAFACGKGFHSTPADVVGGLLALSVVAE